MLMKHIIITLLNVIIRFSLVELDAQSTLSVFESGEYETGKSLLALVNPPVITLT